ncbi:MAG: aldehyde-activating protein [Pseudomonadota bacterium]
MLRGQCICGAVTIELKARPTHINNCNCSLCLRSGALWGYFAPQDVIITGETREFIRNDIGVPALISHFCGHCGNVTHWTSLKGFPQDRMGVNMRLMEAAASAGVTIKYPDGASWDDVSELGYRRPDVIVPETGLAGLCCC